MLISDPDYLIHALRLAYLRNVEDPFGPRVISLRPHYDDNAYIAASGYADVDLWPELNVPSSPQPAPEELLDPQSFRGFNGVEPGLSPVRNRYATQPAEPAGVYPGATGLKYTQTIMPPGRSGGVGMRVSGRRSSNPRSSLESRRIRSDSAPTPVSNNPPDISVEGEDEDSLVDSSLIQVGKRRSSGGSTIMQSLAKTTAIHPDSSVNSPPTPEPITQQGNAPEPPKEPSNNLPPLPPFALKFAQSAEMESRRRERMRARFMGAAARAQASGGTLSQPAAPGDISQAVEDSPVRQTAISSPGAIDSSDDERPAGQGEGVDDGDEADGDESAEDDEEDEIDEVAVEDEFEGDEFLSAPFPIPPVVGEATISDDTSMLSSGVSASQSSAFGSSLHAAHSAHNRHRLSPVSEANGERKDGVPGVKAVPKAATADGHTKPSNGPAPRRLNKSYFSISPPERVNPRNSITSPYTATTSSSMPTRSDPVSAVSPRPPEDVDGPPSPIIHPSFTAPPPPQDPIFTRMPIKKIPMKSALSAMLSAKTSVSDNPFTTLYAAISGRAETASMTLRVYFPQCPAATSTPVELKVRKDATVEEVIGFGLWTYWEQGLDPKLDEGLGGDDDPQRAIKLTAVGWNLHLAEDDGEVDEIALDRTMAASKFSFDDFAICAATAKQIEQNRALETKIVRRPSRLMISKKTRSEGTVATTGSSTLAPPSVNVPISTSATTRSDAFSNTGFNNMSQSGALMSSGPPVFLKVRIATTADMHYSTTITAISEEYMADVLERVCKKRRIENSKEWALLTGDMRIVIPLDRTVASLAGKTELVLVKKALLDQLGLSKDKRLARSSDPNASIFKRMSEVPAANAAMDFMASYKRFTVYRKMPMLVGRHERALAIDGDYIHIMPAASRGLLDSVKTSSYHIKSVVYCKQSKKAPAQVKLIVWRDGGNKTYDFEAEDPKRAAEIVSSIKNLQKSYTLERSGTVKQVGRTRKAPRVYT